MIKVTEAIQAINSNAKYKIVGNDIDTCEIEWFDTTAISKSDIKAKMAELKTALDNCEADEPNYSFGEQCRFCPAKKICPTYKQHGGNNV